MGLESFTYDEINSLDYGMYVTQKTVWDAPKRVVSMIQVAGRNGDLTIDEGKYENARVRYTLKCNAETKDEFAEKVKLFRNELCSRTGYKRLTDTYNQGEYRMGVFITEFSVTGQFNNTAGVFDVEFNCKPQRFLTSGETERSIPEWSDLHTDSGSLVTVDNSSGEYVVKSLSTDIEPQQDLNGYDNPWAGGAGKNMVPDTSLQATVTRTGITATSSNGVVSFSGTSTSSGAEALMIGTSGETILLKAGVTYYFSANWSDGHTPSTSTLRMDLRVYNGSSPIYAYETDVSGGTYTPTEDTYVRLGVRMPANYTVPSGLKAYPIITTDSDTTYEPYSNICPITGFDSANIYVSPTTSVGDATTYNVSFGSAGTVYGGTLDVVSGQLTVKHAMLTLNTVAMNNSENYPGWKASGVRSLIGAGINQGYENVMLNVGTSYFINTNSSNDIFILPKTAYNNMSQSDWIALAIDVQAIIPLATPLTYQLTATQVALLLGTNNLWSDTGDIQIEYGKGGNTLYNPTPFDSLPLIKVTGTGTLGIGDWILTITGLSSQVLYIDCDMMEVYKNTGGIIEGANGLVSINKNTFPALVAGVNNITKSSGLTNLKITPRWWRI